ncbi:metallophosphoesterase [Imperialibacter roseus]|uniref:Metallophosphoesterase n=1 Tax=Imperialibacter roseus TaxID=1324217 RepID=A0ABZ0IWC4_9BACT|nr:metallophosphoesterase [Imperialibacter roseus]WOK08414.1 metallophosphoesterase [Imperialibacter roseus]
MITRRLFLKSSLVTIPAMGLIGNAMAARKPKVRFGVVTDSHYADREPGGIRYYRESLEKMAEFTEVMNMEKVDFVVHLGDFKDEDTNRREEDTLKYLQNLEAVYAQFKGPRYHVIGNHDVDSISKAQFIAKVENTGINSGLGYYSFDKKGFHFIVIDPNFHPDGTDHNKGDFEWFESTVPQPQMDWLKADLGATRLPTVVFVHHSLYELPDETMHVENSAAIRQILEASGRVVAVFHGHCHREGYSSINGIHYTLLPAMVDNSGPENNAYAIIEGFDNGDLELTGYRKTRSRSYPAT